MLRLLFFYYRAISVELPLNHHRILLRCFVSIQTHRGKEPIRVTMYVYFSFVVLPFHWTLEHAAKQLAQTHSMEAFEMGFYCIGVANALPFVFWTDGESETASEIRYVCLFHSHMFTLIRLPFECIVGFHSTKNWVYCWFSSIVYNENLWKNRTQSCTQSAKAMEISLGIGYLMIIPFEIHANGNLIDNFNFNSNLLTLLQYIWCEARGGGDKSEHHPNLVRWWYWFDFYLKSSNQVTTRFKCAQ